MNDPRRAIPRTDAVLAEPEVAALVARFGRARVKAAVVTAQDRARDGGLQPDAVTADVVASLAALSGSTLTSVINATGVVIHTNLGRAPLSPAAGAAMLAAADYVDIEFDLDTGARARRGRGMLDALRGAVPAAADALAVNNGAAALLLATTVCGGGREIVISRGEMVEIGDGFRLPELIESAGVRLREVGTTNRTTVQDYADAVGPDTGAILKVHPSNFRVEGFTSAASVRALAAVARAHGIPLIVDLGSGLLRPEPALPGEPDATTALDDGATIVTASGDKLLGGPQAGIILGEADLIERLRSHPMARALRVDKLTVAALEATLRGPVAPVTVMVRATPSELEGRARLLAERLAACGVRLPAEPVVRVDGRVGGGGAPGVALPGWAVTLPERYAAGLRRGRPAVVARLVGGRCLVDPRCVLPEQEDDLVAAVVAASMSVELGTA